MRTKPGPPLVLLDEDALPGALFRCFYDGIFEFGGDLRHLCRTAWVGENLVAFFDVCEAIVKQCEHWWADFLAKPIARAQILINPDLHLPISP
ncbi:MAG: hypothetical protein ACP5PJ_00665 [Acidimicrobiales bacterium]